MEDFKSRSLGKCKFYKMSVKEDRQSQVVFDWSGKGPVHTMQNFVCLVKISLNRKPLLVGNVFHLPKSSKMPSSRFGDIPFFRWQNSLFLDTYPSTGHHFYQFYQFDVSGYTKNFMSQVLPKFSNCFQMPNFIFCWSAKRACFFKFQMCRFSLLNPIVAFAVV